MDWNWTQIDLQALSKRRPRALNKHSTQQNNSTLRPEVLRPRGERDLKPGLISHTLESLDFPFRAQVTNTIPPPKGSLSNQFNPIQKGFIGMTRKHTLALPKQKWNNSNNWKR